MGIKGKSLGGGGATTLDDLSDVVITTPAAGDLFQYNGAGWINGPYSHSLLTNLTTGDPHSQYLYLAGRAGGQTLLSTAVGDETFVVKAFAAQTGALIRLVSSANVLLTSFVRESNSDGSDVCSIHMVSPAGQNSGAIHLWVAGTKGSGKFAQQYYNNAADTYYTQIVNGTGGKVVFRNFSATGTPTFTLSPTDKGRFGVNTESPGYTLDVYYDGASIFHVSNVGDIVGTTLVCSGNIAGASVSGTSIYANSGGVSNLGLTTDGLNNFLDTINLLKIRDTIGGGTEVASLTKTGKWRLGDGTAATHRLELKAGTATVAPVRVEKGTNLTVAISGCVENDGTDFFLTDDTGDRNRVAPRLLARVTGINLATVGATTLYTVPTGRKLMITAVGLYTTAYTSGTVTFDVRGTTASDGIASTAAGFTAVDQVAYRTPGNNTAVRKVQPAAQAISLQITVSTAVATGACDLFGYLI